MEVSKETMEIFQNTLTGFIQDEDKIVTYKWLSQELEVHINVAKQILEDYWDKNKGKGLLTSTVLIIGYTKDGGMKIELVRGENVDSASEKYEKVISKHIYSLQKVLDDMRLLVGLGNDNKPVIGGIKCDKSILMTDEEYLTRRYGKSAECRPAVQQKSDEQSIPDEKPSVSGGEVVEDKPDEVVEKKTNQPVKEPQKTSTHKGKGSAKQPVQSQQKGFSNLFGKVSSANQKVLTATKKESEKVVTKANEVKEKPEKHEKVSTATKMETEKVASKSNEVNEKPEKNDEAMEIDTQSSTKDDKSDDKSPEIIKSKSQNDKIPKRGVKRAKSQNSVSKKTKKHKRIIAVSDSDNSDSETITLEDTPEDLPAEPMEYINDKGSSPSPSPPPVQKVNGRSKKRKIVDKTFMDDDGFFITKKVEVFESCSEEDEPPPPPSKPTSPSKSSSTLSAVSKTTDKHKKNESTKSKKTNSSNKQTTLTSFFKKL